MGVLAETERWLTQQPDSVRHSARAEIARSLASTLDDPDVLPRDMAGCAKELRATLADLEQASREVPHAGDPIDDFTVRRARKSGTDVPDVA